MVLIFHVRNEVRLDDKLRCSDRLWLVRARVALVASPRSLTSIYCLLRLRLLSCHIFMDPLRIAVRRYFTMARATPYCSPFTQAVVSSMRKLYVFKIGAPRYSGACG